MARRKIGAAPTQKKWSKIAKMGMSEVNSLRKHLENNNQVTSKIYKHVIDHISVLQRI